MAKPINPEEAYKVGAKMMAMFDKYDMSMTERMHLLYMLIGMTIVMYTGGNEDLFADGIDHAARELKLVKLVHGENGPGLWIETPLSSEPTLN